MLRRRPDFDDRRELTVECVSLEMLFFNDDSDHISSVPKRADIKLRDALIATALGFQFAELAIEIDERLRMATD